MFTVLNEMQVKALIGQPASRLEDVITEPYIAVIKNGVIDNFRREAN